MQRTDRILRPLLLLLLAAALLGHSALRAGDTPLQDATLHLRRDGTTVRAVLRLQIAPGWHLNSNDLGDPDAIGLPTQVTLSGGEIAWSPVRFPAGKMMQQTGFDSRIRVHDGTVLLYALGTAKTEGANLAAVRAVIDGQACSDDGSCFQIAETLAPAGEGPAPLFAAFPDDLRVDEAAPPQVNPQTPPATKDEPSAPGPALPDFRPQIETRDHGLATWLLLAFVAGVILNVMPCVLPVVSIKVLSLVEQAGGDRRRMLAHGVVFAAGVLAVFELLAVAAVTLGMSWGGQFQSQAFLLVLITVVFAFSLSLLGVFELAVPKSVNQLAAGPQREGLGGSFAKGMLATVLATPCAGPLLGSTMAWTLRQPPVTIILIFTSMGLGMAIPYVILTVFPPLVKRLPKPGPWMSPFRQAMGFLLLVTVVYLMFSLPPELLIRTNAFLLVVAFACWIWGRYGGAGASRTRAAFAFVIALALTGGGAWGAFHAWTPNADAEAHAQGLHWEDFDADRFAALLKQNRNVLLDFTASWCPNCIYNEQVVLADPTIVELLKEKQVVLLRADMTRNTPKTKRLEDLRKSLGGRSIPYLVVFPADRPAEPLVQADLLTVGRVTEMLDACPTPAGQPENR